MRDILARRMNISTCCYDVFDLLDVLLLSLTRIRSGSLVKWDS